METGKSSTPATPIGRMGGFLRRQLAGERGVALILAIVTLIVLTVIGIAALTSTNVELKVAAGEKAYNIALYNADASSSVTAEVLEEAIVLRGLTAGSYKDSSSRILVDDGAFWEEPMVKEGSSKTWMSWPRDYYNDQTAAKAYDQAEHNHDEDSGSVDLRINIPITSWGSARTSANMDVDYLQFEQLAGGSSLMAMGYEGVGKGMAGGGAKRVYGFANRGDGPVTTGSRPNRVRIYLTYDHII
jgi:hypothetical protein